MKDDAEGLQRGWIVVADIEGFSKKKDVVQRDIATFLVKTVESTYLFRRFLREQKGYSLLCTGDGFILVVAETTVKQPSEFLRFAEEIQLAVSTYESLLAAHAYADASKDDKAFAVRLGIHVGQFYFEDIVGQHNAIGTGVNHAARVAGCGDGGHILTSLQFYRLLDLPLPGESGALAPFGELRIKHGLRISVYNYTRRDPRDHSLVLCGKVERSKIAVHQDGIDNYLVENLSEIERDLVGYLSGRGLAEKDLGLRLTVLVPSDPAPPDWVENKFIVPSRYRYVRGDPRPKPTDTGFETNPPEGVSAIAFVSQKPALVTKLPRRYEEEETYIKALEAVNLKREYIRTIIRPCRAFVAIPFETPVTKFRRVLTVDSLHDLFDTDSEEMKEVVKRLTSHTRNLAELLELTVS